MNTRSSAQESPTILPDGTRFQIWQDETDYRKVYYVDQQHPGAADDNPGTEEAPFLTIQAAAEVVEPAEKEVERTATGESTLTRATALTEKLSLQALSNTVVGSLLVILVVGSLVWLLLQA